MPNIFIISRPALDAEGIHNFLKSESISNWKPASADGQDLIETAGRLCYMSYGKGRKSNAAFIQHILESGHGSVLEHANYSFVITGISRSCSHELIRHRAGFAFSQLSQRYVDESQARMIVPKCLEESATASYWITLQASVQAYSHAIHELEQKFKDEHNSTLRRKMARQAARSVLPNATETKICVTANARALRHFCEVRGTIHADPEIREVACGVLKIMKREAPDIFYDMEVVNGMVSATHHKV